MMNLENSIKDVFTDEEILEFVLENLVEFTREDVVKQMRGET